MGDVIKNSPVNRTKSQLHQLAADEDENSSSSATSRQLGNGNCEKAHWHKIPVRFVSEFDPPRPPPVFLWFECKKSNIYTARFSYVGSTLSLAIWPNTVRRCVNYARLQQPWRIVGKLANYSVTVYTSSGLGNLAGVFTIFMPLANRIFSRRVKSRASAGCRVADRLRSR